MGTGDSTLTTSSYLHISLHVQEHAARRLQVTLPHVGEPAAATCHVSRVALLHVSHLAMVAPSMQRWSADQLTFMTGVGTRSPPLVYLARAHSGHMATLGAEAHLGTV